MVRRHEGVDADMMTLSELKERKRELGLTNKDIAEMAFMPLATVQKVFGGTVSAPRRDTLEKLSLALQEGGYIDRKVKHQLPLEWMSDVELAYEAEKHRGPYKVNDFWKISETRRVELIDGEIYDMAAPSLTHQEITGALYVQLLQNKAKCNKDCKVYIAPAAVQLDADDATIVEPDVFVLCDLTKAKGKAVIGAPEFVLEVVSPGNRSYDMDSKLHKYGEAGCKEYWIVDYERDKIIKYDFTNEYMIEIYTFSDKVPISISDGKCSIDFARIKEEIETGTQFPL